MALPTSSHKVANGGIKVVVGGIEIDVIRSYSPAWENVYDEKNVTTTVDGKEIKPFLGTKFTLSFSSTGMTTADVLSLSAVLSVGASVSLVCPDYTGDVKCVSYSAPLEVANSNRVSYAPTITLESEVDSSGSGSETELTIKINSTTIHNISSYNASWVKVYDEKNAYTTAEGVEIKPFLGSKFSLSVTASQMSSNDMTTLKGLLMAEGAVNLQCPDYSGNINCVGLSTPLEKLSTNELSYTPTISLETEVLSPAAGGQPADGSL